jgi:hypothetical protein
MRLMNKICRFPDSEVAITPHTYIKAELWLSCLRAADRFDSPSLRELAIKVLESYPPAPKIAAAREFGIDGWLKPAYTELCNWRKKLSAAELALFNHDEILKIMKAREEANRIAYNKAHKRTYDEIISDVFGV